MNDEQTGEFNQYLTFTLEDEVFALGIDKVREILDETDITRIPRTPEFLRGVINVRGNAVPVVDLRLKFGMSKTEITVNTCVIITEITIDDEASTIGALADAVQEVIELDPDRIDPPPRMGTAIDSKFIKGMGKQDEHFIIILDVDQLFSAEELAIVSSAGK
jgi:purine-binding chemotaxis protein CheW